MTTRKPRRGGAGSSVRNEILCALLNSEYRHLSPRLELVDLERGETVYRADQRIDYVYFLESAVVAMLDAVEDGSTVEVGIIGREGMVGINIFLGSLITPDQAVVLVAGRAMRMKTNDLRKELRFGDPLQRLLLRYTQVLLAVVSQSVACSQHHTIGQRLARLLLTMRAHTETNEFKLSHKLIAALLGARREGVTQAAVKLQAAGSIAYSRARIRVLDRRRLKEQACECHRFIKRQFDGLLKDVPHVLSRRSPSLYGAGG